MENEGENFLTLKAELDSLQTEQAQGKWDWKDGQPNEKATPDELATWVQSRVRRCVELTSILRRTNTGPAKAAGARGKKKAPDISAIKADLLS